MTSKKDFLDELSRTSEGAKSGVTFGALLTPVEIKKLRQQQPKFHSYETFEFTLRACAALKDARMRRALASALERYSHRVAAAAREALSEQRTAVHKLQQEREEEKAKVKADLESAAALKAEARASLDPDAIARKLELHMRIEAFASDGLTPRMDMTMGLSTEDLTRVLRQARKMIAKLVPLYAGE